MILTEKDTMDTMAKMESVTPTLAQTSTMAASHQIADIQALHEHLCSTIKWYYGIDTFATAISTPPLAKKKLKSIQGTINKLMDQIDDLDEGESFWLWKGLHGYKGFWAGLLQRFSPASDSYRDEKCVLPDGRINLNKLDIDDVIETIKRLNASITHGIEAISKDKKGRKPKSSLAILIYQQQYYWEDTLSRPFTFDEHNGEGITPAYFFCLDAVRIIDPSITSTEIKSQMRKIISETRKDERDKKLQSSSTVNTLRL